MDSKKAAILKARADVLTGVLEEKKQENVLEVLKFLLNHEVFAVELPYVSEVFPLKEYTVVPCTPSFIFGLMNVRRQVFTIIDLSQFFGIGSQEKAKTEKVIILKDGNTSFAIRTGGILSVEVIPHAEIQPAPTTLSGVQTEFLKGITNDGIAILDSAKLLHAKQLIVEETT